MKLKKSKSELAKVVFEAMNARELSIAEPFLKEDVVFDFPGSGTMSGAKRVTLFIKVLLRKFPELTFTIREVIIAEERACTVWTNEGRYQDGNPYENSGMTLFHFEDDKISFMSDYFKNTSFTNKP